MLFNSLNFFLFLGIVLIFFYALPSRYRWFWLLVASYYFYISWEPRNAIYLIVATISAYLCGLGIARAGKKKTKTGFLIAGLFINLGILGFFKYYDFLAAQLDPLLIKSGTTTVESFLPRLDLTNPVGLSFFTFSVVTYLVDLYAGKMDLARHPGKFAVYVAFFPKLFAGPIERARYFLPQMARPVRFEEHKITQGLQLILWGMFKKVVIAENLVDLVDKPFSNPLYTPPIALIMGTYFFAFQIYCDFSGYTDIALGVSKLFGIDLKENFRRSYLAVSTDEFWSRRWHISLGSWFRDYLYFPLGGSRAGRTRQYFNLMTVFVVSGLWHGGLGYGVGWSFLVWGALNGLYQWVGVGTAGLWRKAGDRWPMIRDSSAWHVCRVLFTFHLITFSWIFFRANSTEEAWIIIKRISLSLGSLPQYLPRYPFTQEHFTALALIVFLIAVEILDERRSVWEWLNAAPKLVRWTVYYALIFSMLLLGQWQATEFIYMQF